MRIPQTEYFRLNDGQLNECRNKLTKVVITKKVQTYTDLLDKKDQVEKEALDAEKKNSSIFNVLLKLFGDISMFFFTSNKTTRQLNQVFLIVLFLWVVFVLFRF